MNQYDESQQTDPPPKPSFFCPDCGSSGSIQRDLRSREKPHRTALCCPICGTELTSRPDVPATDSDRDVDRPVLDAD